MPVLALLSSLLAACADGGSSSPAAAGSLEGAAWILDAASMGSLVDQVPAKARVTLEFADGNVSGTAACNSFGGTYRTSGDGGLTISVGAVTMMACPEPVMALESAYLAALGAVTGSQVSGEGRSLLLTGGTVALSYQAEQPLPLVGTAWTLDSIATGTDAVSSVIAGTEATAAFGDDGKVGGTGGCNTYGGTYTVDGTTIAIVDIASTQMACQGGIGDQEQAFFAGLSKAASFTIDGASLTLYDDQGAMLLGFVGTPVA